MERSALYDLILQPLFLEAEQRLGRPLEHADFDWFFARMPPERRARMQADLERYIQARTVRDN